MIWNLVFICLTYIPLQFLAFKKSRGTRRVLAALPLLPMAWLIAGAADPGSYQEGSLYGLNFLVIYPFSMIWLAAVSTTQRQPVVCPGCGHRMRVQSFRFRPPTSCNQCGQSLPQASS